MQLKYFIYIVLLIQTKVLFNSDKSTFLTANFQTKVLSNSDKSTFLTSKSFAIRGFEWCLKVFKSLLKE